jgi:hypothetical protein
MHLDMHCMQEIKAIPFVASCTSKGSLSRALGKCNLPPSSPLTLALSGPPYPVHANLERIHFSELSIYNIGSGQSYEQSTLQGGNAGYEAQALHWYTGITAGLG